jgi:hypothetical protein
MNDTARVLCFPAIIAAGVVLCRRWPGLMRRASRCLAVVNGLAVLVIIAAGWGLRPGHFAAAHRWLAHGLFVLDWSAIPLAIGVTFYGARTHPVAAAARATGLLMLLGVIFLASVTGYLGPSYGHIDAMSFRRFQVLHYWVWPLLAIALVSWWCISTTAADPAR